MIGKVLTDILLADPDVSGSVGNKVYPLVGEQNTKPPFLNYNIDSIVPEYTKNDWIHDASSFSVKATHTSYSGATALIYRVRNALELVKGKYSGVTVSKMKVTGITEDYDYDADTFIKIMSFRCNINGF